MASAPIPAYDSDDDDNSDDSSSNDLDLSIELGSGTETDVDNIYYADEVDDIDDVNGVSIETPDTDNVNNEKQRIGTKLLLEDLAKSGLEPKDLRAYLAQESELSAVGISPHLLIAAPGQTVPIPGYVIPYYDMRGRKLPHYRIRLFRPTSKGPKYLQPAGSSNHVYFPSGFTQLVALTEQLSENNSDPNSLPKTSNRLRTYFPGQRPVLLICEGEKKAAAAVKAGFLCVGVGGIYSWKTRNILLPENVKLEKDPRTGRIRVRMPPTDADTEDEAMDAFSLLAIGMTEIINLVREKDWQIVLIFDTDYPPNLEVQKAASALGLELRARGLTTPQIRQLFLPSNPDPDLDSEKVGLDDFLMNQGPEHLQQLIQHNLTIRCTFPLHPNMQEYLGGKLNRALKREQARNLAIGIIADLDARGIRMRSIDTGAPYYFESAQKKLMPVHLLKNSVEPLHETVFGQHLYETYSITQGDTKLLPWLASSFTGEKPIEDVLPQSVLVGNKGNIYLQISDGQMVRITAQDAQIMDNGTDNILFRADQVDPIDSRQLMEIYTQYDKAEQLPNLWQTVAQQFKFSRTTDPILVSLLFCMSPWLLRWKGTQLPIELMLGEPGSGKSSLYSLRLSILTGRPILRNLPTDIRDWYSSITSQGGLHVTDNVHFATKDIRQRLSDEMCRITTEPSPYVEMRRLYSTADILRIPVTTSFAMTAIQQPFVNADIMQRSIILEMSAVGSDHDSSWVEHQLQSNRGRVGWLAYHIAVIRRFLALANKEWNSRHKSIHRLANFEQILLLMGKVLGVADITTLTNNIVQSSEESVSEYDWTMEGLKEFTQEMRLTFKDKTFTCSDIASWAMCKEDFVDNIILVNARKLARYMKSHATMISKAAKIKEKGVTANRITYGFIS